MLVYAVISITLALVFYTIGVWSERIQGQLKKWHLVIFWLGLVFDTIGTLLMDKLASNGFQLNFHGVTGLLAILLMVFHAVWATIVVVRDNKEARADFHKFSIIVWIIWLIPYVSGAALGMVR
ncbi:HsmA family protein [Lacrimispora celerecrescens]|uniref:Putative repeat protein (TIGR03987 family) n=1 Tax=[Clostridium] celerecrescens 18A TaxID=1286362 RepID=A0A2M8Z1H6_9FIRM|nr:HsmA family protein [Lacrimispora celerecrescens]PJJ27308.1 putative repeat protein (TIGR03987 family) [[Clostridium] celerecrescens 18A]